MTHLNFKTILLVLLCGIAFNTIAQTNDEQLKNYIATANKAENDEDYLAGMKSADSFAKKTNNLAAQALIGREMAAHFNSTDPDESIKYQQKAYRLYVTAGNKDEAATSLAHAAVTMEEQKKDYAEALKFAKRALTTRVEMKDTPGQADMHKYISLLHGKMHNFDDAKKSAAKAIQLYKITGYEPGLAMSYRNLAVVYEEDREYDSSVALLLKAKDIWAHNKENQGVSATRTYTVNSDLARIYTKAGKLEEAGAVVHENEAVDATKYNYTEQFGFYKEARDYYTKNKDKENAKIYKDKYAEMRENLKQEGKKVD